MENKESMEKTVEVSMEHLQNLFGLYDGHIRKIERDFHVEIINRDGQLKILGEEPELSRAWQVMQQLIENGQVAFQYTTPCGKPSGDVKWNPNGSVCAVEGITSPDGRVLGKMAHSERLGNHLYKNVPGEKDQKLFESGVNYFK